LDLVKSEVDRTFQSTEDEQLICCLWTSNPPGMPGAFPFQLWRVGGIFKLAFFLAFEKCFQMVHKTVSIEKPERVLKQTQSNL
jgi:hypothetical protein